MFKNQKPSNMRKWNVLRQRVSTRGGGIEVSLCEHGYEGGKMTAYQNYLGGGMLGRVMSDCNIRDWEDDEKLCEVAQELRAHYHSLTNPEGEWEAVSFEKNQQMPGSAY